MTDKTEAQPEALAVAEELDSNRNAFGDDNAQSKRRAAAELRRLHAEIQQLKAQLSARQAAPDGWRLVPVEPTQEMTAAGCPVGEAVDYFDMGTAYRAMLSAAPPPPEREPLSKQQVSKIALDLLMTNCTWHALQNTGFFHEIVPFTVEIVAAAERAHGIGATNAR